MRERRPRILHVIEATVGGTKRHLLDLVGGLHRAGWDVEVACPRVREQAYGDVSLWGDLGRAGIRTHDVPMRRAALCRANASAILRLRRLIAAQRYAIVHGHSSVGGAVARAAAALTVPRPRTVYTPHGFAFLAPGSTARRGIYLVLERALGRLTDRLIAVSATEAQVADTRAIARGARLATIRNGMDFDAKDSPVETPVAWADAWNGAPVVGNVARLTPQKDPATWLQVAARVAAQRPDVRFVWIGGGELEEVSRAAASKLGLRTRLVFEPYRPDARAVIGRFSVFLSTSRFEGLPYVLLEALASAVPVVATAVVGVHDIVRDGTTGLLAETGDIEGLAARVLRLLDDHDESRRLALAGCLDIHATFSAAAMVETTSRLYESLLAA
jgi:glycosyltransferase involved in cell wall biosynthesis